MKTASRFSGQISSGVFPHLQQNNVPQHATHQSSNSTGLPPPSFNHAFSQGSPNANPLAPTGTMNGLAGGFGGFGPGTGFGGSGTGLASREAQEGFAHGAALQQQAARDQLRKANGSVSKIQQKSRIRDVWKGNLEQEMQLLRELVPKYPYISMDTEFPGIVARPMGAFTNTADYHYQTLRCNVDLLKVIQLGITLFTDTGDMPPAQFSEDSDIPSYRNNFLPCPYTWQFNFQFSLEEDMYSQGSIDFLIANGIDLDGHGSNGIDPAHFGSLLITSGMVLLEDVRWISFHSGYDFAYIVKLMTGKVLPEGEPEYRELLKLHFPAIYDIKYMLNFARRTQSANDNPLSATAQTIFNNLGQRGGLQDLADELGVSRIGKSHQAGSDSLLTGKVFWSMKEKIFSGVLDDERVLNQIWGLKAPQGATSNSTTTDYPASTPNLNGATIYNHPPSQASPATPASSNANTVNTSSTPTQQDQGNRGGVGSLTPGGGGGVFGAFRAFGKG